MHRTLTMRLFCFLFLVKMPIRFFRFFIFISLLLFSTECVTKTLFVKTGTSAQLDIDKPLVNYNTFLWSKNKLNLVRYNKDSRKTIILNENRTVFNNQSFSLILKNMQETDSGIYQAIARENSDVVVVQYNVTVIDAVEVPALTVPYNQSSGHSCTVNFTCSGHDLTLNSTYQNNTCPDGKKTSGISTLILTCTENSIICNYSNPVSWKNETQEVKQLCPQYEENFGWHTRPRKRFSLVPVFILWLLTVLFITVKHFKTSGITAGFRTGIPGMTGNAEVMSDSQNVEL